MGTLNQDAISKLLGKEPPPTVFPLDERLTGQTVLVTGAGGFIGSHLCEELAKYVGTLILVENSEYNLYEVHRRLSVDRRQRVIPILASYGDPVIEQVLKEFRPSTVYHVGAYKHVPMVEKNPIPALRNNVFEAQKFFELCNRLHVNDLVVVSTDKAVNPTNIMGATKRVVEQLAVGACPNVRVRSVRFGNVLWSSGSVLPLFEEQILAGGPVTITHPEVDRYFMSVQEAVHLILQSQFLLGGTYVFDMGAPVLIEQIAKRLIKHMKKPCEIKYVGLRPGEKLHEELALGENLVPTAHPKIMQAQEIAPEYGLVVSVLAQIELEMASHSVGRIRDLLGEIVTGYDPSCGIVDHIWLSRYVFSADRELVDCYASTKPATGAAHGQA